MIKKLASLAALGALYKVLKKDYQTHPFFKAGIINSEGEKVTTSLNSEQKKVHTTFNHFTWKLKRILEKNPIFKWSVISAIASSIFLKESTKLDSGESFDIGYYNGELAIILTSNDPFLSENGVVNVLTTKGEFIVSESSVQRKLNEMLGTGVIPVNPKPLCKKKKKHVRRKADNTTKTV